MTIKETIKEDSYLWEVMVEKEIVAETLFRKKDGHIYIDMIHSYLPHNGYGTKIIKKIMTDFNLDIRGTFINDSKDFWKKQGAELNKNTFKLIVGGL